MPHFKDTFWRVVRWVLRIVLAYLSISILVLLVLTFTIGPKPKPDEEWQVYLVCGVELILIYLCFLTFKSLFKKKKPEETLVYSARRPLAQETPKVNTRFDQRYPRFIAFFERFRIKKIGIAYLTFLNQQEDGTVYATRWFIFGFLPLIPISMDRIRPSEEKTTVRIPFLASSTKLYEERIEIHPLPQRLKRLTLLQVYGLLLPGMFACLGLLLWFLFHPDLGVRNTPAWVYFVSFGGFIALVAYNEYWHTKRFLHRHFPPDA
jgi:hypothetical protein